MKTLFLILMLCVNSFAQSKLELYQSLKLNIEENWDINSWTVLQDGKEISEQKFLALIGYEKPNYLPGLLFSGVGGWMAYKGFSHKEDVLIGNTTYQVDKPNNTIGIIGVAVMTGSFAAVIVESSKALSFDIAKRAADKYNRKLLRDIAGK